ncbi:MAG: signal peptidase I [Candidatus Methanomethylicota archaeon]|nr:signal peptidase I [Candidatus Culexmicrobium cathedralense]RLE47393.1 MAG: signal peptidase I [Candidatus Verstraetearchaeota archaeon]
MSSVSKSSGERKVVKEFLNYLLMLILAFAATQGIQLGAKYILQVETPFVVVASGSMIPTLNVGDILIVRGVNPESLQVGDIIVFKPPSPYWRGMPWVHRIIDKKVRNDGLVFFRTKGDANQAPDPFWISAENVIGKVLLRIPYIGLISLTLKGWTIPVIAIIVILAIVIALAMKE